MADPNLEVFCRQVRSRSRENQDALLLLHRNALTGPVFAILRQELDSMVRCIFLLSVADRQYRARLIEDSVNGNPWRARNGKRKVTDRDMVELASSLHGWTRSVYDFGCAFIHLSAFHDRLARDPFDALSQAERSIIGDHLYHYHCVTVGPETKLRDIEAVLPRVFDKIHSNLECYIEQIEADLDLSP